MTDTVSDAQRFDFGRNWQKFVDRHFSEERVRIAQEHLLAFLKLPDLGGKRMLDIGCGSGMHSLAAMRAMAVKRSLAAPKGQHRPGERRHFYRIILEVARAAQQPQPALGVIPHRVHVE